MDEIKQLDQIEAEQIFELPNSWRDKGSKEEKRNITLEMLKEGISIDTLSLTLMRLRSYSRIYNKDNGKRSQSPTSLIL
jgi:hypothetical protein